MLLSNLDDGRFLSLLVNNLAILQSLGGDLGRSGELYREALELDPHNSTAQYSLAKDPMSLGRLDEAIA